MADNSKIRDSPFGIRSKENAQYKTKAIKVKSKWQDTSKNLVLFIIRQH